MKQPLVAIALMITGLICGIIAQSMGWNNPFLSAATALSFTGFLVMLAWGARIRGDQRLDYLALLSKQRRSQ